LNTAAPLPPPTAWLLRIAKIYENLVPELLQPLAGKSTTRLGSEYWLVTGVAPERLDAPSIARFLRWKLPLHHSWPCCPRRMDQFVEKSAQTLARKFGPAAPQTVLIGPLDPSSRDPYYKQLASNLRGRTLQLFPPLTAPTAEDQDAAADTLFCLVGPEGLFCGISSPRHCHGFYPGGTKFIPQNSASTISRAGAKIAAALHHLRLHQAPPPAAAHWLELGASPGGMTAELLAKGYRVTAIDRAPLDPRLDYSTDLTFIRSTAANYLPVATARFDAILCDMNGEARESIEQVIRLAAHLVSGGLVIFTLKTAGATTLPHLQRLADSVIALAAAAGLQVFAQTHLTYNRHEFTLFFRKR
jgi:hypothetical protein